MPNTSSSSNNNNNTPPAPHLQVEKRSVVPSPQQQQEDFRKTGALQVHILSAYDLPIRDPPSYVALTVLQKSPKNHQGPPLFQRTLQSGPPSQRHKDRNSFKFAPAASSTSPATSPKILTVVAPLPTLYACTARLEMVYAEHPERTLVAEYALKQLRIHEMAWLVLHLEPQQELPATSTSEDARPPQPPSYQAAAGQPTEGDGLAPPSPTLRLQMRLNGPYRAEIALVVQILQAWFHLVDGVQHQARQVTGALPSLPRWPDKNYLILPAVPLVAVVLVSLPIVIGLLIMFLPLVLPLVVVLTSLLALLLAMLVFLWASTAGGRTKVGSMLSPLVGTVLSTPSGQALVYQTGPRPTPVSMARVVLPTGWWAKLVLSLMIDMLGSCSYLLPGVGEMGDVVWAPLQTTLIMAMYEDDPSSSSKTLHHQKLLPYLKYVSFAEEILPFTDILPTATVGWLTEFGLPWVLGQSSSESSSFHSPGPDPATILREWPAS